MMIALFYVCKLGKALWVSADGEYVAQERGIRRGNKFLHLLSSVPSRRSSCYLLASLLLLCCRAATASPIAEYCLSPGESGFAAKHAAAAMGIPFVHTATLSEALKQPMVVLAGEMTGRLMTPSVEAQLSAYIEAGGTLVLDDPESRAALNLVGASNIVPSTQRYALTFQPETGDPGLARLLTPESRKIPLGSHGAGRAVKTQAFTLRPGSGAKVLATFSDGSPALIVRVLGRGRVYAFGVSLTDLILRPQINRDYEAQRYYDNHFEPGADVPQILLHDWYLAYVAGAVTLDPAPDGLAGSLLLTHDVDFQKSMPNMLEYARAEQALGVSATYYIQTKYIRDYEDIAFFDSRAEAQVRAIVAMGAEVACHTVCHAYDWRTFPIGTGHEMAKTYRPRVLSRGASGKTGHTVGGSVGGEIRAPKQLLEASVPGLTVDAFRSGFLLINPAQWSMLEANGYKTDSSYSANDVMTVFPYTAMENANFGRESRITEFPVLLSDSVRPFGDYTGQFEHVLDAEAVFHGVCVFLVHPDTVGNKLPVEVALIRHVRGKFWIGGLEAFGKWWAARGEAAVTTEQNGAEEIVRVTAKSAVSGLTLNFGQPLSLVSAEGTTARVTVTGRTVVLGMIGAGQTVTLHLSGSGGSG